MCNGVEFKRIAQLAVPAVAAKTGPRFCAGGADAEKERGVQQNYMGAHLQRFEASGKTRMDQMEVFMVEARKQYDIGGKFLEDQIVAF